jgi:hypothetical protein
MESELIQLKALSSALPLKLESRAACLISQLMLDRKCFEVYQKLLTLECPSPPRMKSTLQRYERLNWYDPVEKKIVDRKHWEQKTNAHLPSKIEPIKGCKHDGPCNAIDCDCVDKKLLCGKICECSSSCPQRFTGCACHKSGKPCSDERCICVQLKRECDPDLCHSCGAVERANPQNRDNDRLFNTGCANVDLQRGREKQAMIGVSNIGNFWGLFAAEDIRNGEFIAEYVGEIISDEEADRRGKIYDRINLNYLFDLNSSTYGFVKPFLKC